MKRRGSAIASSRLARFCSLPPPAAWVEARTLPVVRPHSPTDAAFAKASLSKTTPRTLLCSHIAVRRGAPHVPELPEEQARVSGLRPDLQATARPRSDTTRTQRSSARHLDSRDRCSSARSGRLFPRPPGLRACSSQLRACARPQHEPARTCSRSIVRAQCCH